MKEQDFLNVIENIIGDKYIGDDCAYLKELGIVITQDSLVENIHFKRDWCTPYQLGYKAIAVNISDILASGSKPAYVTVGLSLPKDISTDFVEEFYRGANDSLYGAKIIGGDITGSESEIFISVAAIGKTLDRKISSRKNAKIGYKVITKGLHGISAAGLKELMIGGKDKELINGHLLPALEYDFAQTIAANIKDDYAMMDTSDGLADALFKIAQASNVKIIIDYNKIPKLNNAQKEDVLFGGEDYKLIAAVPSLFAESIDCAIIGEVLPFDGIRLDISGENFSNYDQIKAFNHF